MTAKLKALLKQAEKLSVDERTILAFDLQKSVEREREAPLSAALRKELDRRIAYMDAHPDEWISWDEVKRGLKARRKR